MGMYGIYRIYKDGKLITEKSNKLTTLGRDNAIKCMLGIRNAFANSLGIGVSENPNSTTEDYLSLNDLEFCVGKYPITSQSVANNNGETDYLVYRARINNPSRFYITELGLFSDTLNQPAVLEDITLFNFENGNPFKQQRGGNTYYLGDPTYTSATATFKTSAGEPPVSYKIGSSCVNLKRATGSVVEESFYYDEYITDLSYLGPNDKFVLAAKTSSSGTKTIDVVLTDINDNTATATYSFSSSDYKIITKKKSEFIPELYALDWSNIKSIKFKPSAVF